MDKPIPEAVLDRLAHEAYQVHCDTPTRAFPNDTHWPKWRAVVQHVADALTAAQQQGQAVACDRLIAKWERQADEHGVRQFTGNDHKLFANELRAAIDQARGKGGGEVGS